MISLSRRPFSPQSAILTRVRVAIVLSALLMAAAVLVAFANVPLTRISSDPYTNPTSQHATEVEPDTFARGSTIVSAFQTGRFFDGGASNIGWATSTDGGATWTNGFLPGITKIDGPANPYDRVSDPAVAYDPEHDVWLISSLALDDNPFVTGVAVIVSRSLDGGLTWGNPVTVSAVGDLDKSWTVCDAWPTSPFYGNCYMQWDDVGAGGRIYMSTSTDGGLTWGPRTAPGGSPSGLGGQPVVKPSGMVIVPISDAFATTIGAFRSTNGGQSWSQMRTISSAPTHLVAGSLRTLPLPSAEVDGAGKVYVAWQDCRFRTACAANDIVMSTSTNGFSWTAPIRIPIDPVTSGVDHFIPGIAVDRDTSGSGAHLALTFYYYPVANCTPVTCRLRVGFISSPDGGASWTAPTPLAGPMALSWLANTNQGRMVGDYISTSYSGGTAHPVFAVAGPQSGTVFNEAMYAPTNGLTVAAESLTAAGAKGPVSDAASDHSAKQARLSRR